jgi:hypothetical protein
MPNFELQLIERLASIEKKLKAAPVPPKTAPILGKLWAIGHDKKIF